MRAELSELAHISQWVGGDVLRVQGGGGNTSIKSADGQRMWIKASGFRLDEVTEAAGWVETDLPALRELLNDAEIAARPRPAAHEEAVRRVQATAIDEHGPRPSLETTFHAVLGRVVLHTHAVYVNAFTCMQGGREALERTFAENFTWVGYAPPGYALGMEVARATNSGGAATATIVMENHGPITSGKTAAEAIAATERLVATGEKFFGALPAAATAVASPPSTLTVWAAQLAVALSKRAPEQGWVARPAKYAALREAAAQPEDWLTAGALTPDDVIYSGREILTARAALSGADWLDGAFDAPPDKFIVAVEGAGVVFAAPSANMLRAMEENLLAHVLVRRLIAQHGGQPRTLPPVEIDYLLAMESEKYRQAVLANPT